jgi:phosphatidylserine/phosphatidylglycerophosphate/cardiolipin synthase-like enzyme
MYDLKNIFDSLVEQMQQRPQLAVTLIVNVERSYRDTSSDGTIVGRFFQNFWTNVWPGRRRPRVFYDRRALADNDKAVLHAKCVVADERRLFITSANLTPRAQTDNIEMGLLVDERTKALSVIRFFERLIADGRLLPLPG